MKQKIFLTSALAMGFVAPAFAEPSNTGEFPSNGLMQEDYTYTKAATEANMGVYEGNVNAVAEYTEIPYSAAEGFYLTGVDDNNNATTAECTSGNFCPGVASTTYENNAFGNTGLQSCSTATSGAYTLSDAGASSSGQCYRTCDGHVSILHATGVTGNDYSDGTNTCAPTACENGYHPKSATPNLMTLISTSEVIGAGFNANNPNAPGFNTSTYRLTQNGEFVVDYGNNGMVHGYGICSTQSGSKGTMSNGAYSDITTFDSLTDEWEQEGARYCYCNLDSYTPNGGSAIASSGVWVFINEGTSNSYCATYCATTCEGIFTSTNTDNADSLALRAALVGSIESSPAMCEANVININWYNADANDISANNAGTATYGSDVRTPVKAQTIKGKTFKGWRFSKPETTNLP